MGYFLSEDCKDLIKDVRNFCENEMKEQVVEAEKLSYYEGGVEECNKMIEKILDGLKQFVKEY